MQLLYEQSANVTRHEAHFSIQLKDWDVDGDYVNSFGLFGWCVSPIINVQNIELYTCGCLVATLVLNIENQEIVELFDYLKPPYRYSFHHRISKFIVPPSHKLELVAWGDDAKGDAARIPLGTLKLIDFCVSQTVYRETTSPLLVVGMGRSGTTMLMGLLARHPQILVPGPPPFEMRQVTWLWQCAHVMSAPFSRNSYSANSFETATPHIVGYNPYRNRDWDLVSGNSIIHTWQEDILPQAAITFSKRLVDDFVRGLSRSSTADHKTYVAQKMSLSSLIFFIRNIYADCKIVLLVRDFRDAWLSARDFNLKRSTQSFERAKFSTDEDWLRGAAHTAKATMDFHASFGNQIHLIRYEDIVRDPNKTFLTFSRPLKFTLT